jgi:hypothetical protein
LARRIRRDLSDKRIKKIINKKLQKSQQGSGRTSKIKTPFFSYIKPFIYFLSFVLLIFLLYQVTNSVNITGFISSGKPDQEKTIQNEQTGETESETVSSKSDRNPPAETQPVLTPVPRKTQVEVLNGCGVTGIAKNTTDFLRKSDIDVVYMGNYSDYNMINSKVIDRNGDREKALRVASLLGIDEQFVQTEINKNKQLDVSVILGKDYKKLKPFIK